MTLEKEKQLFKSGHQLIASIDEAGRGPLAGPVLSACVIIDSSFEIGPDLMAVQDSKKLGAKQREKLFPLIKQAVKAVAIGVCDHKTIDKINILQATLLAMKKSLLATKISPDIVLIDGNYKIPGLKLPQEAIISGDEQVFSIAMASIIAKVSRDFLMQEFHQKYPAYGFDQHKGYGTKQHLAIIKELGPCPIHRLSFAPFKS